MPLPTLETVVQELTRFSSHNLPAVAQNATELLAELQALTPATENQANALGRTLLEQIENPSEALEEAELNDFGFTEVLYHALLVVGRICPRNAHEDEQPLDPITGFAIPANRLFISVNRYQWNIEALATYFAISREMTDPLTRQRFSPRDREMMQELADEYGVLLPVLAAPPHLAFFEAIPVNVQVTADITGLPLNDLFNLFQNQNSNAFNRLFQLRRYVGNFNHVINTHASLSSEQALALTEEESANLVVAYQYILQGHLTVDEARQLSAAERQLLVPGVPEGMVAVAFVQLQQYRELQRLAEVARPATP